MRAILRGLTLLKRKRRSMAVLTWACECEHEWVRSCPRSLLMDTTSLYGCGRTLLGRGVDLVGEDVFSEGLGDGQVEPGQQLGQGFTMAPHQHGQAVVVIIGHSNAADGANHADGDFTVIEQLRDIWQG